jgi:oligo-1,6-glucosidase
MEKKWWKESVVYQIYPKSFKDSNGDGVGDIRGIIQKLDYLKELGVNVLWISPMLESPQDDNGYDISDYRRIYKEYGNMEDYEELLSEAHKRDIRILMDLVVNHTSDEHNWFVESRKSKDNPYRDYYIWKDPVNGKEPNNWGGVFGGSAWEYDAQTQMYYLHLFSKKQPDLNWENEKVRQEVYDMMTFWCEKGIDGFRMDVISMISKDQAFPDGKMNNSLYGDFGPYCVHGPRIHEFLQEMNREVLSRYDIMTVGETSGVTIEEAQKYAGEAGKELNMVFQFEHVDNGSGDYGKWTTEKYDFKEFKRIMIKWQEELQGKAWNSLFLGNHDQPRSVSRFGNDNPAYRETSAKMLATCLHMMQGTPYVYQGEELGMTNVYFDKLEDYRDIESINFFTELTESGLMTPEYMMKCLMLRSRDNARTPMQWDDSEQAGFTDGESWIKVNPNYKEINAAQQLEDPNSIFYYYQKLIRLRKEKDIIVYGGFEPLYRDDEQIFAYIRRQEQEKLLTVCNFSERNAEMEIPEEFKGAECLITNLDRTVFEGKIVLKPYEAFVLYK